MNTLRLSHAGGLHSPPETGAEMPFMQLALVYPVLFGPFIACGCSDRYCERPINVKRGTFRAVQGSSLLHVDQRWLLLTQLG